MPPAVRADKVRVENDEGVVLLQRALNEERDRTLRVVEARVGIDAAGSLEVLHDQR
jgi:hypothetical protein